MAPATGRFSAGTFGTMPSQTNSSGYYTQPNISSAAVISDNQNLINPPSNNLTPSEIETLYQIRSINNRTLKFYCQATTNFQHTPIDPRLSKLQNSLNLEKDEIYAVINIKKSRNTDDGQIIDDEKHAWYFGCKVGRNAICTWQFRAGEDTTFKYFPAEYVKKIIDPMAMGVPLSSQQFRQPSFTTPEVSVGKPAIIKTPYQTANISSNTLNRSANNTTEPL